MGKYGSLTAEAVRPLLGPVYAVPPRAATGLLSPAERLARRIDYRGPEPCASWMGSVMKNGYAQVVVGDRRSVYVHRLIYELFVGPIEEGQDVDHECHNRAVALGLCAGGPCLHRRCGNWSHLVAGSRRDNLLGGVGFVAVQSRRTHCPAGHPYSGENLYVHRGHRHCRSCMNRRHDEREAVARAFR